MGREARLSRVRAGRVPTGPTAHDARRVGLRLLVVLGTELATIACMVVAPQHLDHPVATALLLLCGGASAWAFLWLAAAIVRVVRKALHKRRYDRGHRTPDEAAEARRHADLDAAQDHARALALALATGAPFDIGKVWNVTLEPGETPCCDTLGGYARRHGVDAAGRTHAWLEQQRTRYVVTDRRIIVRRDDATWLDFWYETVRAVYPQVPDGRVVLEFSDCSPLRVEGPAAAVAAVAVVWYRDGLEGLDGHPGLEFLHAEGTQFLQ